LGKENHDFFLGGFNRVKSIRYRGNFLEKGQEVDSLDAFRCDVKDPREEVGTKASQPRFPRNVVSKHNLIRFRIFLNWSSSDGALNRLWLMDALNLIMSSACFVVGFHFVEVQDLRFSCRTMEGQPTDFNFRP